MDDTNGVSIEMPSKNFKVSPTSFLKEIEKFDRITYKLSN